MDRSKMMNPLFRKNFPWSIWWVLSDETKARLSRIWNPYIVIGGYVWPAVYVIGAFLFTQYSANPLMWISFNQPIQLGPLTLGSLKTYDHFWDLLIISALALSFAWYFHKETGIRYLTLGFIASWGSWLMWTQHEGLWWITNLFFDPKGYLLFFGYGSILTMFTVFVFYQFGYVPWRSLLWIAVFYVVWAYFGFHVTVNTEGPTIFYTDPGTFLWEIGSWAWAAGGFWALERKNLLNWYNKSRMTMFLKEIG